MTEFIVTCKGLNVGGFTYCTRAFGRTGVSPGKYLYQIIPDD